MIKALTVINHLGESLKLTLSRPEESGLKILNIDGLGPPSANINSTELSTMDGSVVSSTKIVSRNIVLSLGFMFVPTIEDSRQKAYKYFPIKRNVKLKIETDNRVVSTSGFVEANEPDIFSKESGTQISILCPDPYFYEAKGDGIKYTGFSSVESLFEFPFSNESLSDNLIEMGNILNLHENTVYYNGDAPIGITISIHALGLVKNLTIHNTKTREKIRINTDKLLDFTGDEIIKGDSITISTIKGDKYARLYRDGQSVNILNCIDRPVDWFQLEKGDNVFIYEAEYGVENLEFSIRNRTIYGGI